MVHPVILLKAKTAEGQYGYTPSTAAGVIFLILFILLTLTHVGLVIRLRSLKSAWLIVIAIGGLGEIVGWLGRTLDSTAPSTADANWFILQVVLLIVAPNFFTAALFGIFGRLVRLISPQHSRIRPNLYLWIFCGVDFVSLLVQSAGGVIASGTSDHDKSVMGTNIMVAGITFQMISMVAFSFLAWDFLSKVHRDPSLSVLFSVREKGRNVPRAVLGIRIASVLIMIRCIYRTIELAQGWSGYLITHEAYFFFFDAIPMVATMATLAYSHPYFCSSGMSQEPMKMEEFGKLTTESA